MFEKKAGPKPQDGLALFYKTEKFTSIGLMMMPSRCVHRTSLCVRGCGCDCVFVGVGMVVNMVADVGESEIDEEKA